jgi:hypothetical protein
MNDLHALMEERLEALTLRGGPVLVQWNADPAVAAAGCFAYVSSDGLVVIVGLVLQPKGPRLRATLMRAGRFVTTDDIRAVSDALYGPQIGTVTNRQDVGWLTRSVSLEGPLPSEFLYL